MREAVDLKLIVALVMLMISSSLEVRKKPCLKL